MDVSSVIKTFRCPRTCVGFVFLPINQGSISLSSPAVTPLSSTVGHVQSIPSLLLLAPSLRSLVLSLWSVAGSIAVTTIN